MMDAHWLKDVRGEILFDDLAIPTRNRCAVMSEATLEQIADYSRSHPTSPSPGRIFRKNLHWTGPPANWWVYRVDVSADPKYLADHNPFRVVIV